MLKLLVLLTYCIFVISLETRSAWNRQKNKKSSYLKLSNEIENVQSLVQTTAISTFENSISDTQNKISLPFLEQRRPLKTAILALAARTVRGQIAAFEEKEKAKSLISNLEKYNPVSDPALSDLCYGAWELIYTDTNLFRSSPFFMAARAVCKDGEEADRFNLFCDLHRQALAFTNVGKVKQIIINGSSSVSGNDQLMSEFETSAVLIPGLNFPVVKGTILSSSEIVSKSSSSWSLYMDKVRIKDSTSNIPLFSSFFDTFEGLPIKSLGKSLENFDKLGYQNPCPIFRTIYIDTHMRISKDQDANIFVYNRVA